MKGIEIPFGAKDSELCGWEYKIPEGMEAVVKDGKVIVRRTESEDECTRKELIHFLLYKAGKLLDEETEHKFVSYLQKQKEQKTTEGSEEDEAAFGDLMWCIEQARKSAKDENVMGNIWFAENWLKNRLKSHRPSKDCSDCAKHLEGYISGRSDAENKLLEQFGALVTPEDELHIKPRWKPSEEQMSYLLAVINDPNNIGAESCYMTIKSLYNDLKKL